MPSSVMNFRNEKHPKEEVVGQMPVRTSGQ